MSVAVPVVMLLGVTLEITLEDVAATTSSVTLPNCTESLPPLAVQHSSKSVATPVTVNVVTASVPVVMAVPPAAEQALAWNEHECAVLTVPPSVVAVGTPEETLLGERLEMAIAVVAATVLKVKLP